MRRSTRYIMGNRHQPSVVDFEPSRASWSHSLGDLKIEDAGFYTLSQVCLESAPPWHLGTAAPKYVEAKASSKCTFLAVVHVFLEFVLPPLKLMSLFWFRLRNFVESGVCS